MISPGLAAVAEVPITALLPAVDVATPHPDIEFAVVVIFPAAADEFLTWKIELNCASKLLPILLMELAKLIDATELLSALGPVTISPLEVKSVGEASAARPPIAILYRPAVNDLGIIQTNTSVFDI